MKILLIGLGKINKIIYDINSKNIVGVVGLYEEKISEKPDVIIDFSHPDMLEKTIQYALKYKVPILIGTTGYNNEKMARIKELSKIVPVFKSENMTLGIQLIKKIINENLPIINNYKISLYETHHISKEDSPSGTAIALAKLLNTENVFSKREGDILGIHELVIEDENEEIKIIHSVKNRNVFAVRALEVCQWLIKQKVGYYSMEDYISGM